MALPLTNHPAKQLTNPCALLARRQPRVEAALEPMALPLTNHPAKQLTNPCALLERLHPGVEAANEPMALPDEHRGAHPLGLLVGRTACHQPLLHGTVHVAPTPWLVSSLQQLYHHRLAYQRRSPRLERIPQHALHVRLVRCRAQLGLKGCMLMDCAPLEPSLVELDPLPLLPVSARHVRRARLQRACRLGRRPRRAPPLPAPAQASAVEPPIRGLSASPCGRCALCPLLAQPLRLTLPLADPRALLVAQQPAQGAAHRLQSRPTLCSHVAKRPQASRQTLGHQVLHAHLDELKDDSQLSEGRCIRGEACALLVHWPDARQRGPSGHQAT